MADRGCLLGLDIGNTVVKAVIFDLDGRPLASHALDGPSATPAPGHVERDLDEAWSNACVAIGRALTAAAVDPRHILAIGCAGHGNGLYLLDRQHRPLIGIQSLDSRAAVLAAETDAAAGPALHALALQRPWPAQTPMLMAWLKRHRPDLWREAGTAFLCKDYLVFRLTGERVSDTSDMSGCGLLRLPGGRYDDDLLAFYGLAEDRHLLPPLLDPVEIAGRVTPEAAAATGLAAGTPVVAGLFDVVASAMGSGVIAPGEASIIAGSWSVNQVFSRAPIVDDRLFMAARFGEDRFVTIESSATSAANLEWYVRRLVERGGHHDDPFGACTAALSSVVPAADDPYFHPFLYGARDGAESRAGFYGIAGWHGEGHLVRAIFEGVAFEHRRHVDRLRAAGLAVDRAVLSGGGARSPVWPQIFADVLALPITVAAATETGALGAAIAAAVAVGAATDYEEAVGRMTRAVRTFEPAAASVRRAEARYGTYRALIEAMRPHWAAMAGSGAGR